MIVEATFDAGSRLPMRLFFDRVVGETILAKVGSVTWRFQARGGRGIGRALGWTLTPESVAACTPDKPSLPGLS